MSNIKRSKKIASLLVVVMVLTLLSATAFAASYSYTSADYGAKYDSWSPQPATLSLGSSGDDVLNLKYLLNAYFDSGLDLNSNYFDTATQNAVKKAQSYSGTRSLFGNTYTYSSISADGVVGRYTWGKLFLMH